MDSYPTFYVNCWGAWWKHPTISAKEICSPEYFEFHILMTCTTCFINNYTYKLYSYHWGLLHPGHPERGQVPRFGRSHRQRRWPAVQAGRGSSSHSWLCECDQSALRWAAHCADARYKLCGLTGDRTVHQLLPVYWIRFQWQLHQFYKWKSVYSSCGVFLRLEFCSSRLHVGEHALLYLYTTCMTLTFPTFVLLTRISAGSFVEI